MNPTRLTALAAATCTLALVAACFGPALLGDRQFAYRDAGNFYYPLYQRVQQEWGAGRLPLWEPEENGGMPLLGNPTAAVLYPGKLIHAALPYPWAVRVYTVAHVLLAFLGMAALLRHWSVSATGTAIGALAYAFGAPVLCQYCNIIFLVGAAWMPLGFREADRWVRQGRRWALVTLSLILALQTLGGDPEAAYLTGAAAGAYALGLWAGRAGKVRRVLLATLAIYLLGVTWLTIGFVIGKSWPAPRVVMMGLWAVAGAFVLVRWWARRAAPGLEATLLGLAVAGLLGLALTGVQLVPTLEFMGQSLRTSDALTENTLYDFSIHPARLVEFVWPNVFGTTVAGNRRWLASLPPVHDFQVWVESLYMGGIVALLAASAAGASRETPWRGWLTGVVAIGLLGSFGTYGSPLFWARCVPAVAERVGGHEEPDGKRGDGLPHDGDGGVYWFLATALPGFRSFRYPGKLLVPAALGLCGLAGIGWDRWVAGNLRRVTMLAAMLGLASLGCLAIVIGNRPIVARWLQSGSEYALSAYGPLDVPGAMSEMTWAFAAGLLTAAFGFVLARQARRGRLAGLAALGLLTLDLAWANARWVETVPQALFDAKPRALEVIEAAEKREPSPGPFRVHRPLHWSPVSWVNAGSKTRADEMVRWDRDCLRPKYGIPYALPYTFASGTTELSDLVVFFDSFDVALDPETAAKNGLKPDQKVMYYTRRGFDLWNTRYFILPARLAFASPHRGILSFLPGTTEVDPPAGAFEGPGGVEKRRRWLIEDDVQVVRNEQAFPRAWVVHQARVWPPLARGDDAERERRMTEILYQDDELWHVPGRRVFDPGRLAWVEADDTQRKALAGLSSRSADPSERVVVGRQDPCRVELTASLRSKGLVILADVFYPGWRLEVDGRPAEILRTNRMMRGAVVGAGTHTLVYTYEPVSLRIGLAVSVAGLAGLVALSLWSRNSPPAGAAGA